jgi:hypothetical protein
MINNLFVFDFDDTLATTMSTIGVARSYKGKNDPLFREWLINHDLFPVDEKESGDGMIYYYLSSDEYATYQKFASKHINDSTIDHFDFADTAGVDIDSSKPIKKMINVLKDAESTPNSRVIVVTARITDEFDSPFGQTQATNREDIANFLSNVGSSVGGAQIFPVGSSDPAKKSVIVKKYIESLQPKNVYFYDDNDLNLEAIHDLCDLFSPAVNISTIKISDGVPQAPREC